MIISEVSDFKKDELRHELRHEPANNFAIYINGKQWKVFKGKGRYADDSLEQAHHANLRRWCHEKSRKTGKDWKVQITGARVSEANQAKASDSKPKKIKPNKGHESPHPMRGKLVGESQLDETPIALLRVGVPLLAKLLKAGAKRPIRSTIALDAMDGELDSLQSIVTWLSDKLSQFFDITTLTNAAKIVFKYKIPVLGITAAVYGGKFLVDYLKNAKGDARMQKTNQAIQTEDAQSELESNVYDLEAALREARTITKEIKYANSHMDIIVKLQSLANKLGVQIEEYNEKQVYAAMNALESAVYELEEPFKDALRDAQNKLDDLEYAGEGNIPQKPKPYGGNPVAKNIEKFNKPATHTDKKKDLKKGNVKHKGSLYDQLKTLEDKQRLDPKCWKGYKKQGTKMKGGVKVNNCVPK